MILFLFDGALRQVWNYAYGGAAACPDSVVPDNVFSIPDVLGLPLDGIPRDGIPEPSLSAQVGARSTLVPTPGI